MPPPSFRLDWYPRFSLWYLYWHIFKNFGWAFSLYSLIYVHRQAINAADQLNTCLLWLWVRTIGDTTLIITTSVIFLLLLLVWSFFERSILVIYDYIWQSVCTKIITARAISVFFVFLCGQKARQFCARTKRTKLQFQLTYLSGQGFLLLINMTPIILKASKLFH